MSKILFFGDVVGKPGRQGVARVLPMLKEKYNPDLIIANVENLAHGKGVTLPTLGELKELGIDIFTSGNHVFEKGQQSLECFRTYQELIRPENYEGLYPGGGVYRMQKNGQWFCIINLNGAVFFDQQFRGTVLNPFFALDELLAQKAQNGDIILVDLHAEATSEKVAFGWHADGRVAVVVGTHSHVPTADAWVMPGGTAYITDVGMVGPKHSVIGMKTESSLNRFLERGKGSYEPAEGGPVVVNAVLIEIEGAKAKSIEHIQTEVEL